MKIFNQTIYLFVLFLFLFGCKEEGNRTGMSASDSSNYKLYIEDKPILLEGLDYFMSDNMNFPKDSNKIYYTSQLEIKGEIFRPESDSDPVKFSVDGNNLTRINSSNFTLSLPGSEEYKIKVETGYRKPFYFYIKHIENTNSEDKIESNVKAENITGIESKDQNSEVDETNAESSTDNPVIENNDDRLISDERPKSVKVEKEKVDTLNIEHKGNPDYELVFINNTPLYRKKAKEEPKSLKPKRLKRSGIIAKNTETCKSASVIPGPFKFTIKPKVDIELQNLKVIGVSNWDALITIEGGDSKITISNEQVVPSNCELSLRNNQGRLKAGEIYTITITSTTSTASLVDLSKCDGAISSNQHITIIGTGSNVVYSISYKY